MGTKIINGKEYISQKLMLDRVYQKVKISETKFIEYRKAGIFQADHVEYVDFLKRNIPYYFPSSVSRIAQAIRKEKATRKLLIGKHKKT